LELREEVMTRQLLFIAGLMAILIGAGCAAKAPYNPFKVDQNEFYSKTKTIALAGMTVPEGLEDPEAVRAKFESLITAKLREAGFSIVPSREAVEIWKRMTEQVDGYFDSVTGKRDEAKLQAVREHTLGELRTKFKMDAVLKPTIQVVKAPWSGGTAHWDGTKDSVKSFGKQMGEALPFALLGVAVSYEGTVPALSLVVTVEDRNGVNVYANRGGIQVLGKFSRKQFISDPASAILTNEERNVAAVNIAIDPLIRKSEFTEAR
jgi:hypothetical protein